MTWWIMHMQVKYTQKGSVKNEAYLAEPPPFNSWCVVYSYSFTWKQIP